MTEFQIIVTILLSCCDPEISAEENWEQIVGLGHGWSINEKYKPYFMIMCNQKGASLLREGGIETFEFSKAKILTALRPRLNDIKNCQLSLFI